MAKDNYNSRAYNFLVKSGYIDPQDVNFNSFNTQMSNPEFSRSVYSNFEDAKKKGKIGTLKPYEEFVSEFGVTSNPTTTTETEVTEVPGSRESFPTMDELNTPINNQPLPNTGGIGTSTNQPNTTTTETQIAPLDQQAGQVQGGTLANAPKQQFQWSGQLVQGGQPQVQAQMPQTPEQGAVQQKSVNPADLALSTLGSAETSLISQIGSELKGIAETGYSLDNKIVSALEGTPFEGGYKAPYSKPEDSWIYQAGQGLQNFTEENLYRNPEYAGGIADIVGQGLASVGAIALTGGLNPAGGIMKLGTKAMTNPQLVAYGASQLFKAPMIRGAFATIGQETDSARQLHRMANQMDKDAYVVERMALGEDKADAGKAWETLRTKTEDEVAESMILPGVFAGITEAVPLERLLVRLGKPAQNIVLNAFKQGGIQGAEEATQEVIQQTIINAGISNTYNEAQKLTTGLMESAEGGGATGFVLGSVLTALVGKRANVKQRLQAGQISSKDAIAEMEDINKAEKLVQDKLQALDNVVNSKANEETKKLTESKEAETFFESNEASLTNPITTMPTQVETIMDKIDGGILISPESLHEAYQWTNNAVKETLANQALTPAEKGATLNILNGMLSDIDKANTEGQEFVEQVEAVSVQDRLPAKIEAVLPEGQKPGETKTTALDQAKQIREDNRKKQAGTNVLPSSGQTIVTPTTTTETVATGEITAQQAEEIKSDVTKAQEINTKIPADIKDTEFRVAAIGLIEEREGLQAQLETVDEAFKPAIQEKIKTINEQLAGMTTQETAPTTTETTEEVTETPKGKQQLNIQENETAKQEVPMLDGVRDGGNQGQVGQESTELRTQEAGQTQANAEGEIGQQAGQIEGQLSPETTATTEVVTGQVEGQPEANAVGGEVEVPKTLSELKLRDEITQTLENKLKKLELERTNKLIENKGKGRFDDRLKDEIDDVKRKLYQRENELATRRNSELETKIKDGTLLKLINDNKISAEDARGLIIESGIEVPSEIQSIVDKNKKDKKENKQSIIERDTDFLGNDKEAYMVNNDKTNGIRTKEDVEYFKSNVKRAIDNGKYQKAISEGKMTANDAKIIIESYGLKVPKEIVDQSPTEAPVATGGQEVVDVVTEVPTLTPLNATDVAQVEKIENASEKGRELALAKPTNKELKRAFDNSQDLSDRAHKAGIYDGKTLKIGGQEIALDTPAKFKAFLLNDGNYKALSEAVKDVKTTKSVAQNIMGQFETMQNDAETSNDKIDNESNSGIILQSGVSLDNILAGMRAGMKTLGYGDKIIANYTTQVEDWTATAMRKAMKSQNKFIAKAANIAQGYIRNIARTGSEIDTRRKALGNVKLSPLTALDFYNNAVAIVNNNPQALQRVHQVLDPDAYEGAVTMNGLPRVKLADLNPEERRLYDILRNTLDFIHQWHFDNGFIKQETYDKYQGTYSPRMWEDADYLDAGADLAVMFQQMGKSLDKSYIKKRKEIDDIPNDIIEDPVYGTALRMAQTLRNQAIIDYATKISTSNAVWDGQGNPPPGYVLLEGPKYGPLNGKYVARDVAEDFKGYYMIGDLANEMYRFIRLYDNTDARQFIKQGKTVFNPVTLLGNMLSNFSFGFTAGVDPMNLLANSKKAFDAVKNKNEDYKFLISEGVLGTDVFTQDIKKKSESVRKPVAPQPKNIKEKIFDKLDLVRDVYGGTDDVAKLSIYYSLLEQGKTKEQAAKIVFNSTQNYNEVGRMYDFASKVPFIGNPYIKFKADLGRLVKNSITQKPLTTAAYVGALYAFAAMASKLSGEEEEVRKAREARSFIPKVPMPKFMEKIGLGDVPLVWQTKYGEVNAARLFSPMYVYDTGEEGFLGNAAEISSYMPFQTRRNNDESSVIQVLPQFNDPFLGPIVDLIMDRDFRDKPILDPSKTKYTEGTASEVEQLMNATNYLSNAWIPFYDKAYGVTKAIQGEEDYYGRVRNLPQALLSMVVKVQDMDKPEVIRSLKKDIKFKVSRMEYIQDEQNKKITQNGNLSPSVQKELAEIQSNEKLSPEVKQRKIKEKIDAVRNKYASLENRKAKVWSSILEKKELFDKINP